MPIELIQMITTPAKEIILLKYITLPLKLSS